MKRIARAERPDIPAPGKVRLARTAPQPRARSAPDGVDETRATGARRQRERIVEIASDLFYLHGFSNTTLDAVARQLNVTKPFIYSHFTSKSQLLAEICSHGIRASLDVLTRVLATRDSATDKLRALVRDFMLAVLQNQKHIAIYTRENKHLLPRDAEAINRLRREFDASFHALLQGGARSGEFAVSDAQLASLAIGGIVSWSYVWYRPEGRLSPADTADRISDLVLAMVQARPARGKRARGAACAAAPAPLPPGALTTGTARPASPAIAGRKKSLPAPAGSRYHFQELE